MNDHEVIGDAKAPPSGAFALRTGSGALQWFVGSIVVFFLLIGVALVFWNAANPRPSVQEGREDVVGTSGYYSTEGGHDPLRRPRSTRDELTFRGELTPPSDMPDR